MKKLEKIAEQMFERYSFEETGIKGNWPYLSLKRRAAWMHEAYLSVELVVRAMQETVKPIPVPHKFDTVWSQGNYAGQSNERTAFIGYLHEVLEACEDELDQYRQSVESED